ncbi:MAG: 4-amino-4-deoxy-L-arabinose transferase [Nocardioides sp.]
MSGSEVALARTVDAVLGHSLARPPTLGAGRLVCIDGPAGSGKTTLGDAVVKAASRRVGTVAELHMDDLYEGWAGLGSVTERLTTNVLRPLAQGRPGRYRRWDWLASTWAEEHVVAPVELLVLEGVASAAAAYADLVTTVVWVEADRALRLERGIARDGESMRAEWERWMRAEDALYAAQRTRDRADLLVDGRGELQEPRGPDPATP